jgi:hypothetical protein
MFINDRTKRTNSGRRALTAAGIATLVFSLVVSIGPAIAANGGNGGNGGGNAGTVKIHDATSGLDVDGAGNDPKVCEFWVGFYTSDTAESGTWEILGVAPTGNGSVAEFGSYDTNGDGFDSTGTLALTDGHYSLDWQATNGNQKHKTFWVECEGAESEVDSSPSADAAPSDEESTASDEESTASDEESTPSDEESTPSDEESTPSDEESTPSDEESTPSDEESTPSDEESTPSDEDNGDQGGSAVEPEGQIKGGNPESTVDEEGVDAALGGDGVAELPDTAIPVNQSGVLATIGVLLIIAAHAGTRRERQLPSA